MKLYLLRHGKAVERGTAGYSEEERPLTKEGSEELTQEAGGIKKLVPGFDAILASPFKRAYDTAVIVARAYGAEGGVKKLAALAPGGRFEDVITHLRKFPDWQRVLLTGHEPSLGSMAAALLSLKEGSVTLKKGGLGMLKFEPETFPRNPQLAWLLTPRILRLLKR